ncbi:MAG: hypothetical protein MUF15_08620 [Acidobacteria bacterium]|nr:hypothetical protein [Acidobacteriota bacterium]
MKNINKNIDNLPSATRNPFYKRGSWTSLKFLVNVFLIILLVKALPLLGQQNKKNSPVAPVVLRNLVKIIKPINGWSSDRLMELEAEINDPAINFAYLIENGNERMVRVKDQRVNEKMVLSPGTNQVIVQVKKEGTMFSDHVVLYSEVPKKDIKIILSWDTDGTDVDLHVYNPSGEECYYGSRETKEGGVLDVDITDGYGPEVFTQANAVKGEYRVKVHYYSSHDYPQSFARVQVILFEGTDFEKKYYFEKVLIRTGDSLDVGSFNITELGREKI